MIGFAVIGALGGVGLCLLLSGLVPAKPTLAEVMTEMDRVPGPPAPRAKSLDERVGRVLARTGDVDRYANGQVRQNLRTLAINPATLLGSKLTACVAGLLIGPAFAVVVAVAGLWVGWQLPVLGAVALGAAGYFIPNLDARTKAERRRRDFRR
ncbi:MAG: hypothetical protein ACR2MN_17905, partial [Acidimicrobiales bacterium]